MNVMTAHAPDASSLSSPCLWGATATIPTLQMRTLMPGSEATCSQGQSCVTGLGAPGERRLYHGVPLRIPHFRVLGHQNGTEREH